eukprot:CAMPEP_0206426980 /NCGR_PEP_ID=MMETSP0324_2-20121206/4741_1 /ASSEMBLY_ACC=CAM_ASM_000836 /TAXON_ID=2866 /ORGANISM="Crypthecodinium cohnii, Strain Seligo" /LENGTH=123 /DNA_ID=CAMNT_0053892119 /DNA_START=57 /DNA_END=429 /DNA_ORIENTATION=-
MAWDYDVRQPHSEENWQIDTAYRDPAASGLSGSDVEVITAKKAHTAGPGVFLGVPTSQTATNGRSACVMPLRELRRGEWEHCELRHSAVPTNSRAAGRTEEDQLTGHVRCQTGSCLSKIFKAW